MLHSLDLARPSQIINGYSQEVPEIRDKTIESVPPSLSSKSGSPHFRSRPIKPGKL